MFSVTTSQNTHLEIIGIVNPIVNRYNLHINILHVLDYQYTYVLQYTILSVEILVNY